MKKGNSNMRPQGDRGRPILQRVEIDPSVRVKSKKVLELQPMTFGPDVLQTFGICLRARDDITMYDPE